MLPAGRPGGSEMGGRPGGSEMGSGRGRGPQDLRSSLFPPFWRSCGGGGDVLVHLRGRCPRGTEHLPCPV